MEENEKKLDELFDLLKSMGEDTEDKEDGDAEKDIGSKRTLGHDLAVPII